MIVKRILITITTLVVFGVLAVAGISYWNNSYLNKKIDFIVHDRAGKNNANLSEVDFIKYCKACGCEVEMGDSYMVVSRSNLWGSKQWRLELVSKR